MSPREQLTSGVFPSPPWISSIHPGELELLGAVTGDEMGGGDFAPGRGLRPAPVDRVRAAGTEIAAARRGGRVRHFPFQHAAPRAYPRIGLWSPGQEGRRARTLGGRAKPRCD